MQPIKILIVDDIEENRMILSKLCDSLGEITILTAENGKVAVEIAEEEKPEIILMDIMMPVMDGFEATKRIKNIIPEAIIMVVTALTDSETEEKIVRSGANAYVTKPLDRELTRFKLLNFIRIIRNRNHLYTHTKQTALNPFSNEIRSMKTIWHINNENDMMDFGSWLIEQYSRNNETHTFSFDTKLDILYKIVQAHIQQQKAPFSLIIEDGFENLFITFTKGEKVELEPRLQTKIDTILDDIVFKDHFVHIRIWLVSPKKKEIQPQHPSISEPLSNDPASEEKMRRKINSDENNLLRKSYTEKIEASAYIASLGDVVDELFDLEDIENEWKLHLEEFGFNNDPESLHAVAKAISRYSAVINSLYDFMALAYSMSTLSLFLENITEEKLDETKAKKLHLILGLILEDLENWRNTIFVRQNTPDIHYLDSSLFSSCVQVESIMTEAAIEHDDDEEDIEFF